MLLPSLQAALLMELSLTLGRAEKFRNDKIKDVSKFKSICWCLTWKYGCWMQATFYLLKVCLRVKNMILVGIFSRRTFNLDWFGMVTVTSLTYKLCTSIRLWGQLGIPALQDTLS
jgi:hypothetical protein